MIREGSTSVKYNSRSRAAVGPISGNHGAMYGYSDLFPSSNVVDSETKTEFGFRLRISDWRVKTGSTGTKSLYSIYKLL